MRKIVSEYRVAGRRLLRVVQGDITLEQVDAIVNAANGQLAHGGGVAGAIVRRGGRSIQSESDAWVKQHGAVPTGGAAITGAGDLAARHVIHAVGPVWGTSDEVAMLARAVHSVLNVASDYDVRTISIPAISAGIFGFPHALCAQVIVDAVSEYLLRSAETSLREVNVVLLDGEMARLFDEAASNRLGISTGPTNAELPGI